MPNNLPLACVIAWLLLICGCQSYSPPLSPPVQVATAECLPPPAPDVWWMEQFEPTLTQDLLNEFSASPIEAIAPSSP
ncbi:hypothetical protein [Phytopseudomonas dryadis]|uniref:Uncharacterized protein n=1 Tax=Phytopseudomonas dryadis TaxID=2487520 RepID=A0A4Q9QUE6_9GAMM|nr:hypothetical protein [Pseudomonas dryadis]TBU86799.1 hypothetical protein DNK44_22120 [Pseudomonas dryadis]